MPILPHMKIFFLKKGTVCCSTCLPIFFAVVTPVLRSGQSSACHRWVMNSIDNPVTVTISHNPLLVMIFITHVDFLKHLYNPVYSGSCTVPVEFNVEEKKIIFFWWTYGFLRNHRYVTCCVTVVSARSLCRNHTNLKRVLMTVITSTSVSSLVLYSAGTYPNLPVHENSQELLFVITIQQFKSILTSSRHLNHLNFIKMVTRVGDLSHHCHYSDSERVTMRHEESGTVCDVTTEGSQSLNSWCKSVEISETNRNK